jgi:ADP-ribosylglycohydrolase/sugar/nucleoside kinase (ribokinase family)
MTVLVAGNAALLDLIMTGDRVPGRAEVASLLDGPGRQGAWRPGGAALAAALAIREQGMAVRLWHPLPKGPAAGADIALLGRQGVELDHCPRSNVEPARCLMVNAGEARLAWSDQHPDLDIDDVDALLAGVEHVVIAPVWGRWASQLADAAAARSIPISLFGAAPPEALGRAWRMAVLDRDQHRDAPGLTAEIAAITNGVQGASIVVSPQRPIHISAQPAKVVDTTGAGDAFAGAFIGRILLGDEPSAAGHEAARIAARACEVWGTLAPFAALKAKPASTREDRVQGALAGLACGDAFGMPNSFLRTPPWRMRMEPGPAESPYHAGYPAGRITDDTEQALALTDALEDGFTVDSVVERLNQWFVAVGGSASLAVGPSTMRALIAFQTGQPVQTIGETGVSNGAAMRIAPIGVYAALSGFDLRETTAVVRTACWPTHATSPAISGALSVAWAIAAAIGGKSWDEVVQAGLAGAQAGAEEGRWIYAADIARRIEAALRLARTCASATDLAHLVSDVIGAGEPTTETAPAAFAIADFCKGDPALAIEIAGNLRGDTDTIAAIAGAICGAYAGVTALPAEWRALVQSVNDLDFEAWAARLEKASGAGVLAA